MSFPEVTVQDDMFKRVQANIKSCLKAGTASNPA